MNFSPFISLAAHILKGSLVIAFVFDYNVFFSLLSPSLICLLIRCNKEHLQKQQPFDYDKYGSILVCICVRCVFFFSSVLRQEYIIYAISNLSHRQFNHILLVD